MTAPIDGDVERFNMLIEDLQRQVEDLHGEVSDLREKVSDNGNRIETLELFEQVVREKCPHVHKSMDQAIKRLISRIVIGDGNG